MFKRFSTTLLILLCVIQSVIIIYFGSEMLIQKLIVPEETFQQQRESVNVIVANREDFTGNIVTYGKVQSENNVVLRTPETNHHKIIVQKIHFNAGEYVREGFPLVTFKCTELDYKLKSLKKDLESYLKNLDRLLKTASNVSENEIESTKLKVEKAEAEYLAMKSFIESLDIKAPFSGYIGIPNITEGEQVTPGKVVTSIVSQGNLKVEFYIDPEQSKHIKTGDNIVVSTLDINNYSTGTIIGINPYIDENNSKIKVVAKLLEDNHELFKHNLNIKIYIDKNTIKNVFIVPTNTIIEEGGNTYVAKIERGYSGPEGRIVNVCVIDTKGEICAIVSEALQNGDYIIYEGVIKRDGIPVYVSKIID